MDLGYLLPYQNPGTSSSHPGIGTLAVPTMSTAPNWTGRALDPSRPSSPVPAADNPAATIDEFFFGPFGTLPSIEELMKDLQDKAQR